MKYLISALVLASVTAPALAQGEDTQDERQQILDTFWSEMEDGDTEGALKSLFNKAGEEMMAPAQRRLLQSQIDTANVTYGPIRTCKLYGETTTADMVSNYRYLCQHDRVVTRWEVTLIRLPDGWQGGYIKFDDRFYEAAD